MKNFKRFYYSIFTLLLAGFIFISCEKEEITIDEVMESSTVKQESASNGFGNKAACTDDLTNDGCNFLSGSGRDMPNQYLMINMMKPSLLLVVSVISPFLFSMSFL